MIEDLVRLIDFLDGSLRIHQHGGATGCFAVALIFLAMLAGLFVVLFAPGVMTAWPLR